MREEAFRDWLEANGANTEAGRSTRCYAVRTVEAKLSELGFEQNTLEEILAADLFAELRQAIADLRRDFDRGGERYRILMPNSDRPRNRLSSWQSWLGQYERFLRGAALGDSDADKIRRHVLETYVEPARERDEETVELVVKTVNDALALNQAWPNICQAMRGRKFLDLADVPPPQSFGADMSSATRFRFDLDRENFWALRILRSRYGAPIAQSRKMESFELADGRQIAIDLEVARAQIWFEGKIQSREVPGFETKLYAPTAPRHSNLPARLKSGRGQAQDVSLVTFPNADMLVEVLSEYDANVLTIDGASLARLKSRFLAEFPDFETGGGFAGRSSYHPKEDDYKRALLIRAQERIASQQGDPQSLGALLIDLISGEAGLESNLLGWRMGSALQDRRRQHPGLLESAAADLVRADPLEGIIDFVERTWDKAFATEGNHPYSDSRTIPSLLGALCHPQAAIGLRTDRFNNLAEALIGRRLFAFSPLVRSELDLAILLCTQILSVMRDDWGWKPRDLWDVQGFIWVACRTKLSEDSQIMSDELLLSRFDGNPDFRETRRSWTPDQIRSFCLMARAIHEAGLDWYHTNIPETRFGRKEQADRSAEGTLGTIQIRKDHAYLEFSHQYRRVGLSGIFAFNETDAERFVEAIEDADVSLKQWRCPDPPRAGKWPDEYGEAGIEAPESDRMMTPTNLILYGPPGTGKTFKTMELAVELCGEMPAPDRGDLRAQYIRLRDVEKRIEFVTFHQNFAYEDFVEGLRPQTGAESEEAISSGGFSLEPVAGVFKKLCTRADEARKSSHDGQAIDLQGRKVFKMSLGRAGIEDEIFEDAWAGDYIVLGWGGEIDWSDYSSYQAIHDRWNEDHPGTHGSDSNIAQVNRFVVDMKPGDLVVISYGNSRIRAIAEVTGHYQFAPTETRDYNHRRQVRWLRRFETPVDASIVSSTNFSQKSCYRIPEANLDRAGLATLLPGHGDVSGKAKQFVMVIDEINRANISKVFGELITLIEPDKRLGQGEEIQVRLPYSKETFGVPENLHLIGTMNTADRSIALLDTALRRRFRFKELTPDPSQLSRVQGVDLPSILNTINARIEYLLDRDHAIGHAFFMGEAGQDRAAIDATMRYKVIPLLQEYFFEDWSKIHAVLGSGFIRGTQLLAPPDLDSRYAIEERMTWSINTLQSQAGSSILAERADFPDDAYDILLGKAQAAPAGDASQDDLR